MIAAESWDVVVAGAGPAGLSAARAAAAAGVRTLLLERNPEIGIPVRTSGASWIADLERLGVPARFVHATRKVRLASPGREVRFEYDPPINGVLDVRGLYQHLAIEAARAGAQVRVRSRVTGLDGEAVRLERGPELRAAVVIDATGVAAAIARHRGLASGSRRVGIGAELELFAPAWDPEELWLAMGSHVAPRGYAWIFPAPQERVRVGVGLLSPDAGLDPSPYLRALVASTPQLAGAAELELHRGVIPADGPAARCVADRLLLAGDSAGHVLATAGEGIRFALELGALAGEVAAEAVKRGDTSAAGLARYEHDWSRRYRGLFELTDRLNRRLAALDDAGWDSALGWLEKAGPGIAARLMRGDVFQGGVRQRLIEALIPVLKWAV